MGNILFFKKLMENVGASRVTIAAVFMIVLLMGACAGGNKKPTLSQANETGQVSAKAEPGNGETSGDQEIVCRYRKFTGSRFKHKVCNTKAQWARLDNKNAEKTDSFLDEIDKTSRTAILPESDGMGGGGASGMPR